jgi:putative transposase
MPYDHHRHHRRSTRLPGFDYHKAGRYFVTICTHGHLCTFGEVVDGVCTPTPEGRIAEDELNVVKQRRDNVIIGANIIMPNHVHVIFAVSRDSKSNTLGSIVGQYKAAVSRNVNGMNGTRGVPVWQRNYHDHVIRDDDELRVIREYIAMNPLRWEQDCMYPGKRT